MSRGFDTALSDDGSVDHFAHICVGHFMSCFARACLFTSFTSF